MTTYSLRKHRLHSISLLVDDNFHPLREVKSAELANFELADLYGTYWDYPAGFIGAYGFEGKIFFFIQDQQFDLADPLLHLEIFPEDHGKKFRASYDETLLAEFSYVPPEPIDWIDDSDEEDDFLLSTVNLKTTPGEIAHVAKIWNDLRFSND